MTACKETKRVVAKAKNDATKHIYDDLDTKEGQVKTYKIAKVRQRTRQDKLSINTIKDRDGTILTDEKLIKERWKSYFEELLNVENPRDQLEQVEAVDGPEDDISRTEMEKAVKQMRNNKAPGPSRITAEMIKVLCELGVDWLHTILNGFLKDERMLRWILGLTLKDRRRNDDIRHIVGVACITDIGQGTRGQAEMVWAYTTKRR